MKNNLTEIIKKTTRKALMPCVLTSVLATGCATGGKIVGPVGEFTMYTATSDKVDRLKTNTANNPNLPEGYAFEFDPYTLLATNDLGCFNFPDLHKVVLENASYEELPTVLPRILGGYSDSVIENAVYCAASKDLERESDEWRRRMKYTEKVVPSLLAGWLIKKYWVDDGVLPCSDSGIGTGYSGEKVIEDAVSIGGGNSEKTGAGIVGKIASEVLKECKP